MHGIMYIKFTEYLSQHILPHVMCDWS